VRILYAALDQVVPGSLGGSVHVEAVARGLASLGHEVHVATQMRSSTAQPPVASAVRASSPDGPVWHAIGPPLGQPRLRALRAGRIEALARRVRAEIVMERYHNFGGEGIIAAHRLGLPAVLEVNAPIAEVPGSAKAWVDRALVVQPMRRWRDRLCRLTDLFVTPTTDILPSWIDRRQVLEVEWGADIEAFRPDRSGVAGPFARDPGRIMCVFAGAFRSWHGAVHLAAALGRLHASGERRFGAVFIGDGPERATVERAAAGVPGVIFTGAVPHAKLPALLAATDIGVAPFDPARHRALQLGFYWSPLKIFEYMASGLPVVTPRLPRLASLVEHGREGWLYDPGESDGLDRALVALADPSLRQRLGAAARARVVRDFSWQAHCAALDARLRTLVPSHP
jgi:glycosyltransferase involved in cell wall biosynthesis